MMVLSALRPDASLGEFLAHRARAAPVIRLAAEAVAAVAVLGAALWWNPRAQLVIASASVCFASYALWGLLDRASAIASTRGWPATALALAYSRGLCVVIGVIAGAGVLLSVWAL